MITVEITGSFNGEIDFQGDSKEELVLVGDIESVDQGITKAMEKMLEHELDRLYACSISVEVKDDQ